MTDNPKDSAEDKPEFAIPVLNFIKDKHPEIWKTKGYPTMMDCVNIAESYAKQEVKKACRKQREIIADRHFNNYGQVTTRKLRDKIVEFILNAPSPQD